MLEFKKCAVEGCDRAVECKTWCKKHYCRVLRNNGNPLGGRNGPGSSLQWLLDLVGTWSNECIDWPFAKRWNGYGEMNFRGKKMAANRVMCILAHGEPPTELHHAAHSCGRGMQGCVNPLHLRWATRSENETDKLEHGTHNRGERHGMHVLTADQVREMRTLFGTMSVYAIAKKYGVSRMTADAVRTGKNWGWLS